MSKIDCGACDDMITNAPEFAQNGVTDEVCTSLQNDTGFNPKLSTLHTDCEDLNAANDCLVGRMDDEVETYNVCDWKPFMHKFLPNLYELLKAGICAICGIWKNIHKLWDKVNQHDCEIKTLFTGFSFKVGEWTDTTKTHIVAGQGVSFLNRSSSQTSTDVALYYVAGGLLAGSGSVTFYSTDFTDADGTRRAGNEEWAKTGVTKWGNELVYEYRIKKSEYPEVARIWNGFGMAENLDAYTVRARVFTEGQYAFGQHGGCDTTTGEPISDATSRGHLVPAGWIYVQVRIQHITEIIKSGQTSSQSTPIFYAGIRFNRDDIEC